MVGFEGTVDLLQSPVSYTLKKTPRNEDEFLDLHSCVTPLWLGYFTPSPSDPYSLRAHTHSHTPTEREQENTRLPSFAVLPRWLQHTRAVSAPCRQP